MALDDGHDAGVNDVRILGTAGLAGPQGPISPPEFADAGRIGAVPLDALIG
jgi:hypothetical protein